MKIVYAASEITPFASTGGLAEVAGALPAALHELGHEIIRVMPMYRSVLELRPEAKPLGVQLAIPVGFRVYNADIWYSDGLAPRTYFIRRDEFFDRSQIYSLPDRDYDDNFERYIFFQKAVVALIDHMKLAPDVVHGNDWQCGLLPYFLNHGIKGAGRNRTEAFIFTIHNLAYQGIYSGADYSLTNLPMNCFSMQTLEYYGKLNCLKGGITAAQAVTTVSPTYAKEMQTKEWGFGLEGLIASVSGKVSGILNGIDTDVWSPAKDPIIPVRYTSSSPGGKWTCRNGLLRSNRLQADEQTVLLGMVTRMVDQKGMDKLADIMPELMKKNVAIFILGSGQLKYHVLCQDWCAKWTGKVACHIGYDARLAHKVIAASDLLLIPSRYEPCGLSQFYAMQYGTLPVANAVGGLEDSIADISADGTTGTGFKYTGGTAAGLLSAIERGIALKDQPAKWVAAQQRAMNQDFSWSIPAQRHIDLYKSAMSWR